MSGLDMVREIIGQINNLRKLVTVNGKQYKYDQKSKSYKADGRTFTPSQLKAQLEGQSYKAPSLKIKKTPSKGGPLKDVVSAVANIGVDRGMHALYNKFSGKKTTFKSWQAMQNALKDPRGSWVVKKSQVNKPDSKDNKTTTFKGAKRINRRPTGAERNEIVKENAEKATLGKIITTKDYEHGRRQTIKGKTKYWNKNTNSWQTNKPGPFIKKSTYKSTPPTSTTPTRAEKLKTGMRTWRTDSEEQKKLNKGETNNKVKIKSRKSNAKPRKSIVNKKASAKPIKSTTAEAEAKKKWLEKTRNSPAQRSGAFDPAQLWEAQKRYRKFKKDNNRK